MNKAALIAMVEVNAAAMTDTFLVASWRVAYQQAAVVLWERDTQEQHDTWVAIRDIYARELDRRERAAR